MSTLKQAIEVLSSEFTAAILDALRGSSFSDIADAGHAGGGKRHTNGVSGPAHAAPSHGSKSRRGKGGRLARRSPDELAAMTAKVVTFVRSHRNGVGAEEIRTGLGIERKELPRPVAEALSQRLLTKKGRKRATMYFATTGAKVPGTAGKKSVKKTAKKSVKKTAKKSVKKTAKKSKR